MARAARKATTTVKKRTKRRSAVWKRTKAGHYTRDTRKWGVWTIRHLASGKWRFTARKYGARSEADTLLLAKRAASNLLRSLMPTKRSAQQRQRSR